MSVVRIGDKFVGSGQPCFIIAEIGINHNGDIEIAKQLIDLAIMTGCDAVKFQKRTIDVVYTAEELAKPRENKFGPTNGDLKRGLEFGKKEYDEIDRYCRENNIIWFASPWDEASVDFLEQYGLPCYKIASASLTDDDLIAYIKSKGRPIILSTGMSTIEQIGNAIKIIGEDSLILLHCVATYPSKSEEINLGVINTLKEAFPGVSVGYSGHESGVAMSLAAVAMGACVIERHVTLDRASWGSDHAASLESKGISLLVRDIREFEIARGDGIKRLIDSEVPIMKKLRRKGL